MSLVSNPQAGYASTPLAKSENSGVADMFAAAGVSSNLTSMMQPYLKQLNALSFGDYIKDLVSVSGADSGANVAAAQYDLKQASNNEAAMANLVSPMGNMMSMLGGGGGGGGGGINTTGMNLGGTGAGIDAGGVGATGGTAELDAAAMLA
jgi:hypothetical protein